MGEEALIWLVLCLLMPDTEEINPIKREVSPDSEKDNIPTPRVICGNYPAGFA